MTTLHLDYETSSEIDLKKQGLDVYSSHPSTKVLMCSYAFDNDDVTIWDASNGEPFPAHVAEAIADPLVEKWAFNAQFERVVSRRVLKIKTPIRGWRCTMVLAYLQSFFGTLEQVGRQVELPQDKLKLAEGKRLIKMFCMPQKVTARNPLRWRNSWTDPEDWALFLTYCMGDTESERAIKRRLIKFPIRPEDWEDYEIDQAVNDRGIPLDPKFIDNAIWMSERRKEELTVMLKRLTNLANPNSPAQLLKWLRERGYPFDDLRKDTVKKVLTENAEVAGAEVEIIVEAGGEEDDDSDTLVLPPAVDGGFLTKEAVAALKLRQQVARTSVRKYNTMAAVLGPGQRFRFGTQFCGASRTGRAAGRKVQVQNLSRPPKELSVGKDGMAAGAKEDSHLVTATELIRAGDYEGLELFVDEPMNALAGTVRSAIRAPDDYELMATDLSSIETCVIAWVSGCERLLNVFRNKLDPYKDFGSRMYAVSYDEVVGKLRQDSKPAVLGCGFRLGGGELKDGKKTGLWAYAESLGVAMSKEQAHKAVRLYRETYPEVPKLWYALEDAVKQAIRTRGKAQPIIRIGSQKIIVPVVIEMMKPYLTIKLPSGRRLYYYKPRIEKSWMKGRPTADHPQGEPFEKENFTYMGKQQNGQAWVRIFSHGGKITENIVQAIARDILYTGKRRAFRAGYPLIFDVHDELVALIKRMSNEFTVDGLIELMTQDMEAEYPGLPLAAAGWKAPFYRKD